jgi:hypothetical protein
MVKISNVLCEHFRMAFDAERILPAAAKSARVTIKPDVEGLTVVKQELWKVGPRFISLTVESVHQDHKVFRTFLWAAVYYQRLVKALFVLP